MFEKDKNERANTNQVETEKEIKVAGREYFLAIKDSKTDAKPLDLPELGMKVFVKPMGALDQETLNQEMIEFYENDKGETKWKHNPAGMELKTLVRILCDEKGERLFKDDEYKLLADKPQGIMKKLYNAAVDIHKIPENLEKNSSTAEKGGLPSD